MDSTRSSRWTRSVALGMLIVATVVGNASLRASETASIGAAPAVSEAGRIDSPTAENLVLAHGEHLMAIASQGSESAIDSQRGDGETSVAGSPDDSGQVVPALYAWDPDVRFVFYRHVSKWM